MWGMCVDVWKDQKGHLLIFQPQDNYSIHIIHIFAVT